MTRLNLISENLKRIVRILKDLVLIIAGYRLLSIAMALIPVSIVLTF